MARQYEMYLQTRQAPDNCYLWVVDYLWLWVNFVRFVYLYAIASCWTLPWLGCALLAAPANHAAL
jgi:hypothetical protein